MIMSTKRFHQLGLVLVCLVLLVACGEIVDIPASQTQVVPTTIAIAPTVAIQATSGDATARLKQELQADQVLVNTVTLASGTPAVLTIDYRFNDHGMGSGQVDVGTAMAVEADRVVRAVSKRVVEQVQAGTPIDRVVMHMHLGQSDAPDTRRINVADMQAWSAGQLSDEAYRTHWCCDTAPDGSVPAAYPGPGARPAGSYPAPGSAGTATPVN